MSIIGIENQNCQICDKYEGIRIRKIFICYECIKEHCTAINCKICNELLGYFDSQKMVNIHPICIDCCETIEESAHLKLDPPSEEEIIDEEKIEDEDEANAEEDALEEELEDLDEAYTSSSESVETTKTYPKRTSKRIKYT